MFSSNIYNAVFITTTIASIFIAFVYFLLQMGREEFQQYTKCYKDMYISKGHTVIYIVLFFMILLACAIIYIMGCNNPYESVSNVNNSINLGMWLLLISIGILLALNLFVILKFRNIVERVLKNKKIASISGKLRSWLMIIIPIIVFVSIMGMYKHDNSISSLDSESGQGSLNFNGKLIYSFNIPKSKIPQINDDVNIKLNNNFLASSKVQKSYISNNINNVVLKIDNDKEITFTTNKKFDVLDGDKISITDKNGSIFNFNLMKRSTNYEILSYVIVTLAFIVYESALMGYLNVFYELGELNQYDIRYSDNKIMRNVKIISKDNDFIVICDKSNKLLWINKDKISEIEPIDDEKSKKNKTKIHKLFRMLRKDKAGLIENKYDNKVDVISNDVKKIKEFLGIK